MQIVEIFKSIDGEGIRAGYPVTFIRLFGCNLHCSYCDTRYACDAGEPNDALSIDNIMDCVKRLECPMVTITGGEPMIHPGINKLIDRLIIEGYHVNVETNGTMNPVRFDDPFAEGSVFYTMDWKCGSSGMSSKMSIDRVNLLTPRDVLKFVVGDQDDLKEALTVIESMDSNPQIFFSPVFGDIEPKEIVEFILDKKLYNCRMQLQMHKFIWPVDQRGV